MNDSSTPALPRRNNALVFGLAIVVVAGLLVLLSLRLIQVQAAPLATGSAPAFELKTFEGQTLRLADLRGKPVVVNFWASWCNPCREEAALLQEAWKQYKDQGLILIGVDYIDTEPEARKYMTEFGITYPNGPDVGTLISQAYRITGVPETYFITRDGKLLSGYDSAGRAYGNWIGPVPKSALQERLKKLMAP